MIAASGAMLYPIPCIKRWWWLVIGDGEDDDDIGYVDDKDEDVVDDDDDDDDGDEYDGDVEYDDDDDDDEADDDSILSQASGRKRTRWEKGGGLGASLNCVALSKQILYYKYKQIQMLNYTNRKTHK